MRHCPAKNVRGTRCGKLLCLAAEHYRHYRFARCDRHVRGNGFQYCQEHIERITHYDRYGYVTDGQPLIGYGHSHNTDPDPLCPGEHMMMPPLDSGWPCEFPGCEKEGLVVEATKDRPSPEFWCEEHSPDPSLADEEDEETY